MTYFYTAIFRPTTGEVLREVNGDVTIVMAEHFADEVERNKRAKQFEAHARSLGEADPWMVYTGVRPLEWSLAFAKYLEDHPMGAGVDQDARDKIMADATKAADKVKSVSILTDPEVDDSQDARTLPAWAIAQHEVEAAEQAVKDAQAGHDAIKARADQMDAAAYSTRPDRGPIEAGARQRADSARQEAEQAQARLYHAQENLKAKKAALAPLIAERDKGAKK